MRRRALLRLAVGRRFYAAFAHGVGERVEQRPAVFPADAGVGDALTVDRAACREQDPAGPLSNGSRPSSPKMRSSPAAICAATSRPTSTCLLRILAAVGVAAVDHQRAREPGFRELFARGVDAGGVVVRLSCRRAG